jgi:hypothetical protein
MKSKKQVPSQQKIVTNPAHWPQEVLPLFEKALTCEFASLTRHGIPITYPLTPYIGEDERTLDVSTGLTYPAKAERARRNPKVGMLYSDAIGTGLPDAPTVLVYGLATVRDADLQANTDRYVCFSLAKAPAAFKGMPVLLLRRFAWYFARIWIEVTPLQILWWTASHMDEPPQIWYAPTDIQAPPSDPAPAGKQPPAWLEVPSQWRNAAAYAIKHLGLPILTVVNADGFPCPLRVKSVSLSSEGFSLELPSGISANISTTSGSACLTFHAHPTVFSSQENKVFLGTTIPQNGALFFKVERPLADWSLSGSRLMAGWAFLSKSRQLAPRLQTEAARRGQPVPKVHIPDFW